MFTLSSFSQFSSQQDGSWHSAYTWGTEEVEPESARIPGANDNVTINHIVNSIIASPECADMYLGPSGQLYIHTTINGTLTNNGYVGDDPNHGSDYTRISLGGDFYNNGGTSIGEFYFIGSGGQTIYNSSSTPMHLSYAKNQNLGNPITIANTTTFNYTHFLCKENDMTVLDSIDVLTFQQSSIDGCDFNGNGCTLQMDTNEYGHPSEIGWSGAYTFDPRFTKVRNVTLESNDYIYIEASGESVWGVELVNVVNNAKIIGDGAFFTDSVFTNNGHISAAFNQELDIIAKHDFVNNGTIMMTLKAQKDVFFPIGASWEHAVIIMSGSEDQEITFDEDIIPYYFSIDANVTGATTYQWYRNMTMIVGETDADLDLKRDNPTSIDDIDGEYYCVTDQGNSRKVNITAGNDFEKPLVPSNVMGLVTSNNDTVHLSWDANAEPDLAAYYVYRDDSLMTSTTSTNYTDTSYYGASARYYVSAIDYSGNESAKSTAHITYPQVHSTAAGGSWQQTTTWVGGILPASSDSVIINGPVFSNTSPTVSHIYVTDSGSLQKDWSITKIKVSGNLYVDGAIFNCNGDGIEIGGNLSVNGTLHSNTILFTGSNDHYISMHDTAKIFGTYFGSTTSRIIAKSDLYLGKLGESTTHIFALDLDLSEGYDLHTSCARIGYYSYIPQTKISGGGQSIYSNDNNPNNQYFIEYSRLEDVQFHGNTYLKNSIVLVGEVSNEDSMLMSVSSNGYSVDVQGNFTNNGYMYTDLKFKFHKNLINSDYMRCGEVKFVGDSDHELSCLNHNKILSYGGFYCDSNMVIAQTDLYLYANYYGYNILETDCNGYDLYLENIGIGDNTSLRPVVYADGSAITMNASGYFEGCDIHGAVIRGVSRLYNGVHFYGETVVEDTLCNYSTDPWDVDFFGPLINNGHLGKTTNGYSSINPILYQSFTNNGFASLNKVTFVGDSIHTISGAEEIYSYRGFFCDSSQVIIDSDVKIKGEYNVVETTVNDNCQLSIEGVVGYYSWGNRARINADGNNIKMTGTSSYFDYCDLYNANLKGISVATSNVGLYGNSVVEDTLIAYSTSSRIVNVYGNLTNLGVISSVGRTTPILNLHQSFINNGLCDVFNMKFVSDSIHELSTLNGNEIYSYWGYTCDSSKVLAMSDLYLRAQNEVYNVVETDLSKGYDLYLTDARVGYYSWDKRSVIKAAGNDVKMVGSSSYYNKCDIYNAKLKGISIMTSKAGLYGDIILEDTLVGYSNSDNTPNIYGDFTNNGYIGGMPSFYKPSLNVHKSFTNNGVCEVFNFNFVGDDVHELSTSSEVFSYVGFTCDSSKVLAMSDLHLRAQNDVYNVVETDLSNGYDLYLTNIRVGYYSWGKRSSIKADGNEVKMMGNSSYYNKCDIYDATLRGVSIVSGEVAMHGDIILEDTLVGYSNSDRTPNVYANFTNNGYIGGTPDFYKPSLSCYGDIISNGIWDSQDLAIVGSADQVIYLDSTINSNVEMLSDNGVSAFQWKKNNVDLAGETSNTLEFTSSLMENDKGIYVCANNEGSSRDIIVTTTTEGIPTSERSVANSVSAIEIYPNPAQDMIVIKNATPEASYKVLNLAGNILIKGFVGDGVLRIDKLETGIYLVEISQNNECYVQRLMVR